MGLEDSRPEEEAFATESEANWAIYKTNKDEILRTAKALSPLDPEDFDGGMGGRLLLSAAFAAQTDKLSLEEFKDLLQRGINNGGDFSELATKLPQRETPYISEGKVSFLNVKMPNAEEATSWVGAMFNDKTPLSEIIKRLKEEQ